jgi:hypothetical protein
MRQMVSQKIVLTGFLIHAPIFYFWGFYFKLWSYNLLVHSILIFLLHQHVYNWFHLYS